MSTQRDRGLLASLARRLFTSSQLHILIVDPDLTGAQLLAAALGPQHETRVVGSAAAAFLAIKEQMPTIVATELRLPDAPGLDFLTALHTRPVTRHVLLMALTAQASMREKIAAFQAGADDCLIKPVAPQRFAEHIERLSRFRQVIGTSTLGMPPTNDAGGLRL